MKKRVIAVTSGGLDSITMALKMYYDGHTVTLFHGDLGQKSEEREHEAVVKIADILGIASFFVDLGWLGRLGKSCLTDEEYSVPLGMDSLEESISIRDKKVPGLWTPGRNLVLLSCAAAFAEAEGAGMIVFGGNASEVAYPDNTMEFADRLTEVFKYGCLCPPKVVIPFYTLDKVELLKWGYTTGYNEVYKYTWSCDLGGEYTCGKCGCCCNRRFAFKMAGIKDPQKYIDESYFQDVYLKELKIRCTPKMWMWRYLREGKI